MTKLLAFFGISINPWIILAVVLGLGGAGTFVYHKGYRSAELKCNAAKLTSEIATLKADKVILEQQLQQAKDQAKAIAKQRDDDQVENEKLRDELVKTKDGKHCRLTIDDARRLRPKR